MRKRGAILALLGLGLLLGGMVFFAAIMAPLVFTHLPLPVAGPFIRAAFPWYYLYMLVCSGLAALGLGLSRDVWPALIMLVIAGLTVWLWAYFLPVLDALRQAGNEPGFARGHAIATWIDGGELFAVFLLFIRAAARG